MMFFETPELLYHTQQKKNSFLCSDLCRAGGGRVSRNGYVVMEEPEIDRKALAEELIRKFRAQRQLH